jgi:hypothetical protein
MANPKDDENWAGEGFTKPHREPAPPGREKDGSWAGKGFTKPYTEPRADQDDEEAWVWE